MRIDVSIARVLSCIAVPAQLLRLVKCFAITLLNYVLVKFIVKLG